MMMSPPPTLLERAGARVRARRVSLMASPAYLQALHKVNVHKGRDVMLVDLAESSGLTEWVTVVAPAKATTVHLTRFHSEEYIRILREADPLEESASYQGKDADGDNCDDTERQRGIADEANTEGDPRQKRRRWDKQQPACPEDSGVARSGSMAACSLPLERLRRNSEQCKLEEDFGLEDDCSPFAGHFDYSCRVAGASIQAADLLARGSCDVAINWGGGRHHAKKACAAGFCFVNDCVLACLHLLRRFRRVLYFDIDVHHGDGVQEAFAHDDTLLYVSMHHASKGFFPGTGAAAEVGEEGPGRFHTLNLPLKRGAGDKSFTSVFTEVFDRCVEAYRPDAVVLCCGADTLGCDPLGCFNLSTRGLVGCVRHAVNACLPTQEEDKEGGGVGREGIVGGGEKGHPSTSSTSSSSSSSSSCSGAAAGQQHGVSAPSASPSSATSLNDSDTNKLPRRLTPPPPPPPPPSRVLPLLLLGGGGYSPSVTARAWASATAAAAGKYVEEKVFPTEVPSSACTFEAHGPDFLMHPWAKGQPPSLSRKDENSEAYLARLKAHAAQVLAKVSFTLL